VVDFFSTVSVSKNSICGKRDGSLTWPGEKERGTPVDTNRRAELCIALDPREVIQRIENLVELDQVWLTARFSGDIDAEARDRCAESAQANLVADWISTLPSRSSSDAETCLKKFPAWN